MRFKNVGLLKAHSTYVRRPIDDLTQPGALWDGGGGDSWVLHLWVWSETCPGTGLSELPGNGI